MKVKSYIHKTNESGTLVSDKNTFTETSGAVKKWKSVSSENTMIVIKMPRNKRTGNVRSMVVEFESPQEYSDFLAGITVKQQL